MKLAHFTQNDGPIRIGAVLPDGRHLIDIHQLRKEVDPTAEALGARIDDLLALGQLNEVAQMVGRGAAEAGRLGPIPLASVRLRAPVLGPRKIIGIGLNYADHAAEAGAPLPAEPVFFTKFATTIIGDGDPVVLPAVSEEIDWEAELVVVIGSAGRDIPASEAMSFVAGYTVGNDISARDWQLRKPLRQWILGKTFDTFLPLGPYLVTADEVPDPYACQITCEVSGEIMQNAPAAMHFTIADQIAYLSQVITLEPGDLILTGTPGGVGIFRKPARFLRDGDALVTSVGGVGVLRNPVVKKGN